jgi:hypothetical protein
MTRKGTGRLDVFTFKEGLLARAAHDLQLTLGSFPVSLDGEEVRAELPLGELRVVGPVEDGVTRPDGYDAHRRAEIEATMRDKVLAVARQPTALFVGRAREAATGFSVEGELQLAGARAPLAFAVDGADGVYRARFELVPSRWGIAPYRAMLGAIRVQDRVRVEVAVR